MIESCDKCYWFTLSNRGCFKYSKWRKWIAKKDISIPRECLGFKFKGNDKK